MTGSNKNSVKLTWHTEKRKLGELIEWGKNPRQLKEHDAEHLKKSLDNFGVADPLIINTDNRIIGGHMRRRIMLQSGYKPDDLVDVRVPERELTEREAEELAIRLNKNTGDWDFDALANNFELDDLLDWGFEPKELDLDLWAGEAPEDVEPQIDKAEELREKWGVESGQLWQLGEHRLICGDCTDKAVVERVMGGEKAGAVVTDPPYGINREGIENDDPEGLTELFDGCLEVMPIDNAVIIAFQSPRLFPVWLDAIRAHGQKFERMLWEYRANKITFPWRGWMMNGDAIAVSSLGNPAWGKCDAVQDTYIFKAGGADWEKQNHPSAKVIESTEDLVKHTTGIVYDPFLGSGTTLIACERLGRKCRAVEISPAYCAVAIQRWVDVTNGTPELVN